MSVATNINAVIQAIKSHRVNDKHVEFEMSEWTSGCGTAACIGGFTEMVLDVPETSDGWVECGKKLGLVKDKSHDLFFPSSYERTLDNLHCHKIGEKQAVALLEDIRDGKDVYEEGRGFTLPERVWG